MLGKTNVGIVARLLRLQQKLWKTRKEKAIQNEKVDMKSKVNDIKNTTPESQNTTHQEFCFTTNISVYKARDEEKRLGKVLNNEWFEE